MSKLKGAAFPIAILILGLYYFLILRGILYPPKEVGNFTGATAESKPVYGFWSGFGGTLLFSAAVLFPPWYYQHTCHYSYKCLRWGRYEAAGGTFKLCRVHHPDMQGVRPHSDLIHKLHKEWKSNGS